MLAALIASGCVVEDYVPVNFTVHQGKIIANGDIDRSAIESFKKVTSENPNIKTLVLQIINGSVDDEANLELGRMVRRAGFTTVVPSDGLVASGGTDLFLAGEKRILEKGACVGVHSWGDDSSDGNDFPKTSPEHTPYLKYYQVMNIPEEFYWFTLESASASEIHWMNQNEANQYNMTTNPSPDLGLKHECDPR